MATSADRCCSVCDPSSTKADEWCSECDAFLCKDCLRHHRALKLSNQHSTISIKDYEELPDFVKALSYICEDHDERVDLFCPVHNCTCCIRCVLMSHKSCDGVAPLKDFTHDSKNSSTTKDIEQILVDMQSFISNLIGDKENNKQEIHAQQSKILEEIRQIRTSLNIHLDQLEQTLIHSLNETLSETASNIDNLIHELKESKERIDTISKHLSIIQNHATDLQTFLCMSQMTSKISDEEKYIQELRGSGKLKRKAVVFKAKVDDFMKTKSFGDVLVKDFKGNIDYVKEKDKQAQIIGVPHRTVTNIYLKQIAMLKIEVARQRSRCNQISGCGVIANGNFLFSEYNSSVMIDRLTMCNNEGSLIRHLTGHSGTTLRDVTIIDETTYAVSAGTSVEIVNISSGTVISKIKNSNACFGNTYTNGFVIYLGEGEGVRAYNIRSRENTLLIKENFHRFSYVCSDGSHIFYTSGTEAVTCCDMTGKIIWKYEDPSVLRLPQGVAVDRNGNCYVSGGNSGNVVVISPDGKSSKEMYKVPHPRAICYDTTRHQIIVCNTSEAFVFKISENI